MEGCPGGGPSCSAPAASVSVCSSPPGDRLPASIPSSSPLSECVCVCDDSPIQDSWLATAGSVLELVSQSEIRGVCCSFCALAGALLGHFPLPIGTEHESSVRL
jgi:hypothetical protein